MCQQVVFRKSGLLCSEFLISPPHLYRTFCVSEAQRIDGSDDFGSGMALNRNQRMKMGTLSMMRCFLIAPLLMMVATILFVYNGLKFLPLVGENVGGDAPRLVDVISSVLFPLAKESSTSGAQWRSSHSAVLAMATNMGMLEYYNFVGSLRATGYSGHIILGINDGAGDNELNYLRSQNVTIKTQGEKYRDYKVSHARFFLYRDWIENCTSCTDGIMLTDFRDAYFQAGESYHCA